MGEAGAREGQKEKERVERKLMEKGGKEEKKERERREKKRRGSIYR